MDAIINYIEIINEQLTEKLYFEFKKLDNKQSIILRRKNRILKSFEFTNEEGIINFLDGFYAGIDRKGSIY